MNFGVTTMFYYSLNWTRYKMPSFILKWQGDAFMNLAIDSRQLASEREEAKAMILPFLKRLGLSNAVAARTLKKSDHFIMHLISILHSCYRTRYLAGRGLTTNEIRSTLLPYLEGLATEHGGSLVDVLLYFPNPPRKQKYGKHVVSKYDTTSKRVLAKETRYVADEQLHPSLAYLLTFGLDLEQIKVLVHKFPSLVTYSKEGKIKPTVELLLESGITQSDICKIILKRPQLFGCSLTDNLKTVVAHLESIGVEKSSCAKMIAKFPAILMYSQRKIQLLFDFLSEKGISAPDIGKILTRCPQIVSYSIDNNLRPTAAYFNSMGVDVSTLIFRSPQTLGLSVEYNIKPVTNFFLDLGFSLKDVSTMVSRFGTLYTYSLEDNLFPKWSFFVCIGRSKSELVQFPQYFGYSLEERIKPRQKRLEQCGVFLNLNRMLSSCESEFERLLEREMKKIKLNHSAKQQNQGVCIPNLEFVMNKMSIT
eukprot:Gb_15845 [translate_table: standard]